MSVFKRDKKEDEDGIANPYSNLDKTLVLQEAKYFNQTPINPKKCIHILTKILYLLNQGEKFSTQEATEAFFATTKLFQSRDVMLRRMVYLCIKELSAIAQDVIIVTSSLTKDMTGKEDLYRAAAIRALCSVTDTSMLQSIERYMKQAIVDKNPAVSSAALVSSLHLYSTAPDMVRRWTNEAQEAITSDNAMVSYHALGVIAASRQNDKLSTVKLVTRLTKASLKSPYALCLLIRMAAQLVEGDNQSQANQPYFEFIQDCLRHKSEMVNYEAAHAIITLCNTARELAHAVLVLHAFCGSSRPSLKLAGVRTLAGLVTTFPNAVASCSIDLEILSSDPNKSVATLAITTLLAAGSESSVDRLLKQISSFVSDISDEYKIIVVRTIRRLCTKFPRKHQSLAAFLAGMLRDEGSLEYKAAIADVIITLVEENPDAKESGLTHLCEFIEDCEHGALAVRILHLLGREGPKSRQPSRYIRFIYNRVILESGPVRAAAVSAVAQFGAQRPDLLPNIRVLLARCQLDDEDEVRDRAIFYSAVLDSEDPQLISDYIVNVPRPSPVLLEQALSEHLATHPEAPFNLRSIPEDELKESKETPAKTEARKPDHASTEAIYGERLSKIPKIGRLGPIFKTMPPVDLTEAESEYRVHLVKHIFSRYVVFQFDCVNTLNDQTLRNVYVTLQCPPGYEIKAVVSCEELLYNQSDSVFVVVKFPSTLVESLGVFGATLEFSVHDCTGIANPGDGYADSYPLDEFYLGFGDQVKGRAAAEDWDQGWEKAASKPQASNTFVLPHSDLGEAANAVCNFLGLPESSASGDAVKEIRGDGIVRGGTIVLMRAKLVLCGTETTMLLTVRSQREETAKLILASIG